MYVCVGVWVSGGGRREVEEERRERGGRRGVCVGSREGRGGVEKVGVVVVLSETSVTRVLRTL